MHENMKCFKDVSMKQLLIEQEMTEPGPWSWCHMDYELVHMRPDLQSPRSKMNMFVQCDGQGTMEVLQNYRTFSSSVKTPRTVKIHPVCSDQGSQALNVVTVNVLRVFLKV